LEELLGASAYKEKYRQKMIVWGEEKRNDDPGYFARLSTENAEEPIWIISDARRPTDIVYFQVVPTFRCRPLCGPIRA
jgi:phosphomevalonate kinase